MHEAKVMEAMASVTFVNFTSAGGTQWRCESRELHPLRRRARSKGEGGNGNRHFRELYVRGLHAMAV